MWCLAPKYFFRPSKSLAFCRVLRKAQLFLKNPQNTSSAGESLFYIGNMRRAQQHEVHFVVWGFQPMTCVTCTLVAPPCRIGWTKIGENGGVKQSRCFPQSAAWFWVQFLTKMESLLSHPEETLSSWKMKKNNEKDEQTWRKVRYKASWNILAEDVKKKSPKINWCLVTCWHPASTLCCGSLTAEV